MERAQIERLIEEKTDPLSAEINKVKNEQSILFGFMSELQKDTTEIKTMLSQALKIYTSLSIGQRAVVRTVGGVVWLLLKVSTILAAVIYIYNFITQQR